MEWFSRKSRNLASGTESHLILLHCSPSFLYFVPVEKMRWSCAGCSSCRQKVNQRFKEDFRDVKCFVLLCWESRHQCCQWYQSEKAGYLTDPCLESCCQLFCYALINLFLVKEIICLCVSWWVAWITSNESIPSPGPNLYVQQSLWNDLF